MTINEIKRIVLPILRKYDLKKAGIFGSIARGELREDSDVDILVEIERDDLSLLDFVGIKLELEAALGRKVDLVEYDTIKPLLRERILAEEIPIL